jgi:hypothetical protein
MQETQRPLKYKITNTKWEGKMRILFDVLTPKQARMCAAIVGAFKDKYSFEITARRYAETLNVLEHFGITRIGSHSSYGNTKYEKYMNSLEREKYLTQIVKPTPVWSDEYGIDLIITQASIEAVHVGVRLGIPVIVLTDVPQRIFLNKQILPCADFHLRESLTHGHWQYHSASLVWMDAVQEQFYTPPPTGVSKNADTIFYRCFEYKSSYSDNMELHFTRDYVKKFCKDHGYEFVEFHRYNQHEFMTPEEIYDRAVMMVTGGSSMAIEACLLGIPAISFYPFHFPKMSYLERNGYPINKLESVEKQWFEKHLDATINRTLAQARPFQDNPLDILGQMLEVRERWMTKI